MANCFPEFGEALGPQVLLTITTIAMTMTTTTMTVGDALGSQLHFSQLTVMKMKNGKSSLVKVLVRRCWSQSQGAAWFCDQKSLTD